MTRKERPNSGWTRVALIVSVALSCFLIAVGRSDIRDGSAPRTVTETGVTPLATIVSIPLRSMENFFGGLSDRASAYEDNQALKEELALLRERQARYENLAMKVARYESILGVDTQTDIPLEKIAARAVAETDGPFVRSLLINVGRDDGVSVGNPVMSADGLVGHVINLGPDSARVLRLSDLNSRIPVASARSGATAILAGDNNVRPKLSFISQRVDWEIGDRVISSGDDGALPRGLAVGKVVRGEDGGLRVRLASRAHPLDWVWVSPFQPISAPSETDAPEGEPS